MAALLSSEIGNTDKVVQYINEARELGLEVLPPDVNESGFKFTVIDDRRIRFGLGAIKNVGEGAIASILAGRRAARYRSLVDLCDRIDLRLCNKRVLEALIDAGACDSLGGHRAQLVAALEDAFAEAQARQAEREAGQVGMFGEEAPISHPASRIPDVPGWTEHERLAREKAVLGFFISGHPLAKYRTEVELFGTRTTATLGLWSDQKVRVAAVVTVVKRQISKKTGAEYARLILEDFHGTAEALVFPETWAKLNEVIQSDRALLLTGGYSARDRAEEQAPFIVEQARGLDELRVSGAVAVALSWSAASPPDPEAARAAAALCAAHPGPAPLLVEREGGGGGGGGGRGRAWGRGTPATARPRGCAAVPCGSTRPRTCSPPCAPCSAPSTCTCGRPEAMATHTLDFERPLLELERQIEELKRVAGETAVDVSKEIVPLERKLADLRQEIYRSLTPMQRVQVARHPKRPYTLDYLRTVFTDFVELHGDRLYRDDPAIVGGWARLDGASVMGIGHQKGRDTKENLRRNFGMAHPAGNRKALRLMHLAEQFRAPVITLVDTPGAYPGLGAEERGQAEAIARNLLEMSGLRTPIVTAVIGEGGSGGALAVGLADRVIMLENSVYSVISPEGCAAILWKDASQRERAAEALKLTARDLLDLGVIDEIVPEPPGGAHADPEATAQVLGDALRRHAAQLRKVKIVKLLKRREEKYLSMGALNGK